MAEVGTFEPSPLEKHLAKLLQQGLARKGWSQTDLSAATGTSLKHINQLVNGKASAKTSTWSMLLATVGVDDVFTEHHYIPVNAGHCSCGWPGPGEGLGATQQQWLEHVQQARGMTAEP